QLGRNVLHPIGWDAFGLPAENAAIRNQAHPTNCTNANIATQAECFRRYAVSFDWSRRLATCDPDYYRWNQWLFLRFYERDLAYRKDGSVNWGRTDQPLRRPAHVRRGRPGRQGAGPGAADAAQLDRAVRRGRGRVPDRRPGRAGH